MCVSVQTFVSQGTITTPTGWTLQASTGAALDGGTAYVNTYLFYRVASSEPASYNVAYNTGGTFNDIAGNIRGYRGTATTSPINSSATVLTAANQATNTVPALTETFVSGEWYVGCSSTDVNVDVSSTSPVLNNVFDPTPFQILFYMGDLIPGSSPGAQTYTYTGSNAGRTGWGVSIKPLGAAPATSNLLPLQGVGP
jgi:hypothetical protein